jgi:hypothetical protein
VASSGEKWTVLVVVRAARIVRYIPSCADIHVEFGRDSHKWASSHHHFKLRCPASVLFLSPDGGVG